MTSSPLYTIYRNTGLQLLPEHNPRDSWAISKQFCDVIDHLPFYSGVVLEDGESVELSYLRAAGYNPVIPLDAYLKGAMYAVLKEKCRTTYVPKGLEQKVAEKMKSIVSEVSPLNPSPYSGSSQSKLEELQEEENK